MKPRVPKPNDVLMERDGIVRLVDAGSIFVRLRQGYTHLKDPEDAWRRWREQNPKGYEEPE